MYHSVPNMCVKYLFYILVIVSVHQFVSGLNFEKLDYCKFSNNGLCINKTHLLCNVTNRSQLISDESRSTILNTINVFRENLRNSQHICNLPDLKWSQILETLAEAAVVRDNYQDYCFETGDYKYVLYFNLTKINANTDIHTQLNDIISSGDKPAWLYSAYSTTIGCALNYLQNMICIINGIELIHNEQSFGYKDDCTEQISSLASTNCSRRPDEFNCNNNFICNPLRNFNNLKYENLSFTMKRFILHKLMTQNKIVKWNNDLEYLAAQIVMQKITQNDKCLAIELYPNVSDFHFEGTDRYNDRFSNIDNIWHTNNITQNVGCALYTQTTNEQMWNRIQSQFNTHIYCLHSDIIPLEVVLENNSWTMYLISIPVIIIICAALTVFGIKRRTKLNVKKCETEMEASYNSADYFDEIDVR